MPKTKLPVPLNEVQIVELQVQLNPRGRSVINGTVVVAGEMRTLKIELSSAERLEFEQFFKGRTYMLPL